MIRQHFYPKNYIRKKSQRKPTPEQNDHSLRNSHANTHYSVFSCTSSLHKRHMSLPVDSPKLVFYETGAVTEFLPNNNHELSSSSRLQPIPRQNMEREKQNDPRHFILDSRRKALFPQTKLNKRPNTSKRRELSNQDNFDWYCGPTEIVNVKLSEKNGQKYKLDCSKYGNPSLRSRLTYQIAPSLSTDTKFRGWDVLVQDDDFPE